MNDEYLTVPQAAFLLKKTKHQFEAYINHDKIPCVLRQGTRLIHAADLKKYVDKQMSRYDTAREYFDAMNKSSFWELQQKKHWHNQGLYHDESMIEYLTVSQTAYLLQVSRQAVFGYLEREKLCGTYLELPTSRIIVYIRADELERFVDEKDSEYERALQYFDSDNTFEFWSAHQDEFQTSWRKQEKERSRKYYANKKRKIQEKSGEAGKRRTARGKKADPAQTEISGN